MTAYDCERKYSAEVAPRVPAHQLCEKAFEPTRREIVEEANTEISVSQAQDLLTYSLRGVQ